MSSTLTDICKYLKYIKLFHANNNKRKVLFPQQLKLGIERLTKVKQTSSNSGSKVYVLNH